MNYRRISRYYPGCDGTPVAVDLYLPETESKVPVLIRAGYAPRRQVMEEPWERDAILRFLGAEYAVAIVEVRGSGASHGVSDGFYTRKDARDMAALIGAMTGEDWCSGRAGMYGGSNHGMIQEITAAEQPENLFAVIPCDCSMDFYYQNFPNGVSCLPDMPANHHQEIPLGVPVDEDPAPDFPLAHEAKLDHERNKPFLFQHFHNMHRDDLHPALGYRPNLEIPVWERMDAVRFGHIYVWNTGAWFDPGCTNKILTYKSWGGRLLLGPWPHCGIYHNYGGVFPNMDYDWAGEYIRFFDAILKDKNTSALEEPPVLYYTVGDEGSEWHREADFPVSGTRFASLYMDAAAREEGRLNAEAGSGEDSGASQEAAGCGAFFSADGPGENAAVSYKVRDDIMIYGPGMRMNRNVEKDMAGEDAKSLVFTSVPLPKDMEITGIPRMELYVTSTHTDGNFIAVLEEVKPDGTSRFLTEGFMRASHAKVQPNAVYASMGLEYHRGFREDSVELSETEPLRLSFQLEALSRIIPAGSRLRVAVSCGGSGTRQPEGFPAEMPVITVHTGKDFPSKLILPAVAPTATVFTEAPGDKAKEGTGARTLYAFKKAVYMEENGAFRCFPVRQVYPVKPGTLRFETAEFALEIRREGLRAFAEISDAGREFRAEAALKDRFVPEGADPEIPVQKTPWAHYPDTAGRRVLRNLYVATVPSAKGDLGNMNPQQRSTFDLFIDLIYPDEAETCADTGCGVSGSGEGAVLGTAPGKGLPLIINIHGFGGDHHQFETTTEMFLERGYAVASVDYRLCPPNTWPASDDDVRGCIRFLKAHAEELGLDRERFGVAGGSMGGNLTAMIASSNGEKALEGDIGGNTDYDSSVKAGAAYFAFTDYEHFGDDAAAVWPAQPQKVSQCDGPYAPLASLLGYVGPGKGFGALKARRYDPDPEVQRLLALARTASPISHVTKNSAPLALVHGIWDCGIQVPMGQSVRMFEEYARVGVKSLLLCNTLGIFGEDPEVKQAVVEFLAARV